MPQPPPPVPAPPEPAPPPPVPAAREPALPPPVPAPPEPAPPPHEADGAAEDRAPRRAVPLRAATVAALVAALLGGGGVGAGTLIDDDPIAELARILSPRQVADTSRADLNRYMTRLATEWAVMQRAVSRVGREGGSYPCRTLRDRLDGMADELDAIGADPALIDAATRYVTGLEEVIARCAAGRQRDTDVDSAIRDAQAAWGAVRVEALKLGWDTPCALQNTVNACAGA